MAKYDLDFTNPLSQFFVSRRPLQGQAWILQTLAIQFSSVQSSQFSSLQVFISKNPLQEEACILRYSERPRCYKPYEFS